MNLIKAELLRFSSRRFIQIMYVALLIAFGFTIFTVMASTEPATPQLWKQAEAEAEIHRQYLLTEYTSCMNNLTDKTRCADLDPRRVVTEDFLYGVFHFGRNITALIWFLGAFLSLFGYLIMASFIGSELHSGGMTNLLLWRPNRLAVLGAKLGVGLGMLTVVSVIFSLLYVGTFYGIATVSGYAGGMTAAAWSAIALDVLRGIGMALVAGLIAFAVATLGRHTAAALGGLLGYVVVWEGGARLMMQIVTGPSGNDDGYFLSTYIAAWFSGEYRYWDDYYLGAGVEHVIYWWHSAVVFAVIGGGLAALAFTGFKRRDLA